MVLNTYSAIIIGAGPTGLIAALLLAKKGIKVCIIEKHTDVYPLPRAISYDHEVARILNMAGVLEDAQAISDAPDVYQWKSADDELLFELNWADDASLSGYAHSYVFSQPDLERVLNDAALKSELIDIFRGYNVTTIEQDEQNVTVCATDTESKQVIFTAPFAIGADGANSVVRQQIGSDYIDLGFNADWLVVDVIIKPGVLSENETKQMLQVCDPARPTTIVSGGPGRRRWEFMALANETLEELNSASRAWELLHKWGISPDNAKLERHAVYTFKGALANKWSKGRIFIAGDAAHLTPPFAGQGLCAGFRDAAALAWRIALVASNPENMGILNSYETERKQHACLWVENAIELGKVICELDREKAQHRNTMMLEARKQGLPPPSSGILPSLGPGFISQKHHGGILSPGGMVGAKENSAPAHFDNVFDNGFHLIATDEDLMRSLNSALKVKFESFGGHLTDLKKNSQITDIDSVYTDWLGNLNAKCMIIRPDFYVFGVAKDAQDADDLLSTFLAMYEQQVVGG